MDNLRDRMVNYYDELGEEIILNYSKKREKAKNDIEAQLIHERFLKRSRKNAKKHKFWLNMSEMMILPNFLKICLVVFPIILLNSLKRMGVIAPEMYLPSLLHLFYLYTSVYVSIKLTMLIRPVLEFIFDKLDKRKKEVKETQ